MVVFLLLHYQKREVSSMKFLLFFASERGPPLSSDCQNKLLRTYLMLLQLAIAICEYKKFHG